MELLMPGLGLIFWMTIAFAVVLYILKKYAWQPILQILNAREKELAKSFSDAKHIEYEMSQLDVAKSTKIAEAEKSYKEIVAKAEADANLIIEEAKQKAEEEAQEIGEKAEEMIQRYKKEAYSQIKEQLSSLSLELAEQVLLEEFSDRGRNKQYVSKLLDKMNVN